MKIVVKMMDAGFKDLKYAEEITGISHSTLGNRLRTVEPDKEQKLIGDDGNVRTLKGKELVWRSAYSDKGSLVHPSLIKSWKATLDKTKELLERGYVSPTTAGEIVGFGLKEASRLALAFDSNDKIGDEPLVFRSLHGNTVLLHPSLIEQWKSLLRVEKKPPIKPKSIKPNSSDLESNGHGRER